MTIKSSKKRRSKKRRADHVSRRYKKPKPRRGPMSPSALEKINAERRRRALPTLTETEARRALAQAEQGDDFSPVDFLVGYVTGVPMPSVAGVVGALMHKPARAEGKEAATFPNAADVQEAQREASEPNTPAPTPEFTSTDFGSTDFGSDSGGSGGGSNSSGD